MNAKNIYTVVLWSMGTISVMVLLLAIGYHIGYGEYEEAYETGYNVGYDVGQYDGWYAGHDYYAEEICRIMQDTFYIEGYIEGYANAIGFAADHPPAGYDTVGVWNNSDTVIEIAQVGDELYVWKQQAEKS